MPYEGQLPFPLVAASAAALKKIDLRGWSTLTGILRRSGALLARSSLFWRRSFIGSERVAPGGTFRNVSDPGKRFMGVFCSGVSSRFGIVLCASWQSEPAANCASLMQPISKCFKLVQIPLAALNTRHLESQRADAIPSSTHWSMGEAGPWLCSLPPGRSTISPKPRSFSPGTGIASSWAISGMTATPSANTCAGKAMNPAFRDAKTGRRNHCITRATTRNGTGWRTFSVESRDSQVSRHAERSWQSHFLEL